MNPAGQAHAFTHALLGDHGEALRGLKVTVTSFAPRPRTRWVPARADSVASAVLGVADEPATLGVYVGLGLTRGASTGAQRLTVADTAGLAWLAADIDVSGPAHDDSRPYVPDKNTAIELAHACGLPPTVIVDTGHGIQPHWRLAEPWVFGAVDADDDGAPIVDPDRVDADRRAAVELVWSWVTSIRIRAASRGGWFVDPTTDLARLVRAPGSCNRKIDGDHRLVVMLDCDPARRYGRDQLMGVLPPEQFLAPYRNESPGGSSPDLAGVDLVALWAAARSCPRHEPEWVTAVIESGWAPELAEIWSGRADARYGNDDSAIDAALVAIILGYEFGVEAAVEAVMCRRLRIGRRLEKVDPAQRAAYYLGRTISLVATRLRNRQAQLAGARERIDAAVAELVASDQVQLGRELVTDVAGDDSTCNDNTVPVELESTECKENADGSHAAPENASPLEPVRPSLRAIPSPPPDPAAEQAGAPRQPRQGMEGPVPGPPNDTERDRNAQLQAMLGMGTMPGLVVWAVQMRRMESKNQARIWLRRTEATHVHGGTWQPNTFRASRWRSTVDWKTSANVAHLLLDEFQLHVSIPRGWSPDGLLRLYEAARWIRDATPEEAVEQAITGMLRRASGTGLFSTAVATGDAWVVEGEIWVPLDNIREELRRRATVKFSGLAGLVDTLGELGCKVEAGKEVPEGHRVVRDADSWVRLADHAVDEVLRAEVAARAVDRDAQDQRSGVRKIGED